MSGSALLSVFSHDNKFHFVYFSLFDRFCDMFDTTKTYINSIHHVHSDFTAGKLVISQITDQSPLYNKTLNRGDHPYKYTHRRFTNLPSDLLIDSASIQLFSGLLGAQ